MGKTCAAVRIARALAFVLVLVSLFAPWGRSSAGACGAPPVLHSGFQTLALLIVYTGWLGAVPVFALFGSWILVLVWPAGRFSIWFFRVVILFLVVLIIIRFANKGLVLRDPFRLTWGVYLFKLAAMLAGLTELVDVLRVNRPSGASAGV